MLALSVPSVITPRLPSNSMHSGFGIGKGRRLAIERVGDESAAVRKRAVVLVGVVAAKQHHVAETHRPMLLARIVPRARA